MFSIVMLVRDRLRLTQQALAALMQNSSTPHHVTVVDDASKDETREWLHEWAKTHQALYLRSDESRGTGWARNVGIAEARERFGTNNLLYLSDNDVWFAPGWDKVLAEAHIRFPQHKIIGGGCHPFLQPRAGASGLNRFLANGMLYKLVERDAVSGYSWLLSWETWAKHGPLDAHALGVRQSEDFALCRKVVESGASVGSVVPEVIAHTGLFDTFGQRPPGWEMIEQNKREGVLYE